MRCNDLPMAPRHAFGDLDVMMVSLVLTYNEPLLALDKKHFEKVPRLVVELLKEFVTHTQTSCKGSLG